MLNKEKYAKEIIEITLSGNGVALDKNTNKLVTCGNLYLCKDCKFSTECGDCSIEKMQEWANAEYKEPILDEVEREYLSAVCRPYKVVSISKKISFDASIEWIAILVESSSNNGIEYVYLPCFKSGTMYEGMKVKKAYTPQELGITCKNNPNGEIKND